LTVTRRNLRMSYKRGSGSSNVTTVPEIHWFLQSAFKILPGPTRLMYDLRRSQLVTINFADLLRSGLFKISITCDILVTFFQFDPSALRRVTINFTDLLRSGLFKIGIICDILFTFLVMTYAPYV
jgi:hypothetical protein